MANAVDLTLLAVAAMLFAQNARADATGVAEALFQEGRKAMAAGDYATACPKLEESFRLDPAGGTLMNLAACHEKQGKTATAWREFNDALGRAVKDGRNDRVTEAKERIAALEPDLPKLRVIAPAHPPPGFVVELDGVVLGSASFGVRLPVDPGEHELRARASGYRSHEQKVVAEARRALEVRLPELQRLEPRPPAGAPKKREARRESTHPSGGVPASAWIFGGVALVGIGVGSYFGLEAKNRKDESEPECSAGVCTPKGAAALEDADRAAWISNGAFGVGVASLGVATYLVLTAPHSAPGPVGLAPTVAPGFVGVFGRYRF